MITIQDTWNLYEKYVEAWSAIPNEQRAAIIADVFTEDALYFTPNFQGGQKTVIEDIEGFQKKFPGARFDIEDISAHHDVALFTWVLVQPDGTALAKGHDQIRLSPEGKIASLITFAPSTPKP
jgi:ketosteroid isomerase-like protein